MKLGQIIRFRPGKHGGYIARASSGKVCFPMREAEYMVMPGEPYVITRVLEKPKIVLVDICPPDDLEGLLEAGLPVYKQPSIWEGEATLYKGAFYKICTSDKVHIFVSAAIRRRVEIPEKGISYLELADASGQIVAREWPTVSANVARQHFPVVGEEMPVIEPHRLRVAAKTVTRKVTLDLSSIDPRWREVSGAIEEILPPNAGEFALLEWRSRSEVVEVLDSYGDEHWASGRHIGVQKWQARVRHIPTGIEDVVDLTVPPLTIAWGEFPK